MKLKLPDDVLNNWPSDHMSSRDAVAELERLRTAGGSSPAMEVDLTYGQKVRIELPHNRDELVVTKIEQEDEPEE